MTTIPLQDAEPIPGRIPKIHEVSPPEATLPVEMPASPERAARDIDAIGVEGRPADPKWGPGSLVVAMLVGAGVVIAIAGFMAWFFGWAIGLAGLAIGLLAIMFNPVFGATILRAKDRKRVADKESKQNEIAIERSPSR